MKCRKDVKLLPIIELWSNSIVKTDIVVAGHHNDSLIVACSEKLGKSESVCVKLGLVTPLALVKDVAQKEYDLGTVINLKPSIKNQF
jgi:hypothetical protein